MNWLSCRKVAVEEIDGAHDLQAARLFPCLLYNRRAGAGNALDDFRTRTSGR